MRCPMGHFRISIFRFVFVTLMVSGHFWPFFRLFDERSARAFELCPSQKIRMWPTFWALQDLYFEFFMNLPFYGCNFSFMKIGVFLSHYHGTLLDNVVEYEILNIFYMMHFFWKCNGSEIIDKNLIMTSSFRPTPAHPYTVLGGSGSTGRARVSRATLFLQIA